MFCGGALIAPQIVLTVASCQVPFAVGNSVVIGSVQRQPVDPFAPVRTVARQEVHPNYNQVTFEYDFMIVLLSEPVLEPAVQFPSWSTNPTLPANGANATIMGYGRTSRSGPVSNQLLQAQVQVEANEDCLESYGSTFRSTTMICAMGASTSSGGTDDTTTVSGTCQGDSGGPLIVQVETTTSLYPLAEG